MQTNSFGSPPRLTMARLPRVALPVWVIVTCFFAGYPISGKGIRLRVEQANNFLVEPTTSPLRSHALHVHLRHISLTQISHCRLGFFSFSRICVFHLNAVAMLFCCPRCPLVHYDSSLPTSLLPRRCASACISSLIGQYSYGNNGCALLVGCFRVGRSVGRRARIRSP